MDTDQQSEFVVQEFDTERAMHVWLLNEFNLSKLKESYPPERFSARIDLVDRKVIVTRK